MEYPGAAPEIEITDLAVTAGGRAIVSGFSLSVGRGRMAVVSGPSGSGKTTILKAVMGFVEPSSGQVRIGGQLLDGRTVWGLRARMAYLPQELDLGDGTAREALMRPLRYRAAAGVSWDEGKALALMGEFGLGRGVLGEDVRKLSVGEKKRLALAQALLLERPILVLDELTSGLDLHRKRLVLERLRRQPGLTVLGASHDEVFLSYADMVAPITEEGGEGGR